MIVLSDKIKRFFDSFEDKPLRFIIFYESELGTSIGIIAEDRTRKHLKLHFSIKEIENNKTFEGTSKPIKLEDLEKYKEKLIGMMTEFAERMGAVVKGLSFPEGQTFKEAFRYMEKSDFLVYLKKKHKTK